MDGIHLLGEWYGCPVDAPEMTRAEDLRQACIEAVEDVDLTIVGDRFHQFEPQGVTGAVILPESHLAIHTWPEMGYQVKGSLLTVRSVAGVEVTYHYSLRDGRLTLSGGDHERPLIMEQQLEP